MCGRFVASRPIEELVEEFAVDEVRVPAAELPGPRFNISPEAEVLAVREVALAAEEGGPPPVSRRLGTYRWGLVPSWAKDPSIGRRAFNARAETLAEKPMFRAALARRRCIVPADAFYEWQKVPSAAGRVRKQPWCFRRADGHPIGFAGLYELWTPKGDTEAEPLRTCTVITTAANGLMAPVHDRMPAIVLPDRYGEWLEPGPLDAAEVADLLAPAPEDFLTAYEVSAEVSSSRADGPQLAEPLGLRAESPTSSSGSEPAS